MTWWMVLLCIAAALVLLGCIPVGADAQLDGTLTLRVKIGVFRIQLLPQKKRAAKQKKRKKAAPQKRASGARPQAEKKPLLTGDPAQLRQLLELGVRLLGDVRRKLCVERLELFLYFGGDDPAQGAIAYGRAWAVIGGLTPLLDSLFVIRKRRIEPRFVPGEAKMRFAGRMVVTMTVGRAVGLGLRAGFGLLKIVAEKRKGEAKV